MDTIRQCNSFADALLVLWLQGRRQAFERLVDLLRHAGIRFAARLLGGADVCLAGMSAEDVVGDALVETLPHLESGKVAPGGVVTFFFRRIHWRVVDLWRRSGREVPLELQDDAGGEPRTVCDPVDAGPSPEGRLLLGEWLVELRPWLVERNQALARREAALAKQRQLTLVAWCDWTTILLQQCARCPAQRLVLRQTRNYLRARILEALPEGHQTRGVALAALAAAADPARIAASSTSLNAHLCGLPDHRGEPRRRNAVDLAWTRLRNRSRKSPVPLPPPLGVPLDGGQDAVLPLLAAPPLPPTLRAIPRRMSTLPGLRAAC